jgi:outer membrane protein OmpA-like peptidoglycan-associated protein
MIIMSAVMSISIASAQYGPTKFTDNITVGVKGGVATPMNDFFGGVSPIIGLQAEKYVTPWLGFAVDANTLIAAPYGSMNPHTAFDVVNINLLGKWNLRNTYNYDGTRKMFEPTVFAGFGWGHNTCSDMMPRNFMMAKTGVDFDFNLGKEKAWGIRVSPAVVWGPFNDGKLHKNNGGFEITAGVVYHFKNKDGNRAYTKVTPRSQAEIDALNSYITHLRRENVGLIKSNKKMRSIMEAQAKQAPKVVTVRDTVYVNLDTHEYFKVGSAEVLSQASIRTLARSMDNTKHYVVVGYASEEGSKEFNDKLSRRRAETVYNLLVKFGFPAENLEFRGEGPTTQFSTDDRNANRVVVVEQK